MFIAKNNRIEIARWLDSGIDNKECLLISRYENSNYTPEMMLVPDNFGVNIVKINFEQNNAKNGEKYAYKFNLITDLNFIAELNAGNDYYGAYKAFSVPIEDIYLTTFNDKDLNQGFEELKTDKNLVLLTNDNYSFEYVDGKLVYAGINHKNKINLTVGRLYEKGYLLLHLNDAYKSWNK